MVITFTELERLECALPRGTKLRYLTAECAHCGERNYLNVNGPAALFDASAFEFEMLGVKCRYMRDEWEDLGTEALAALVIARLTGS